MIMILSSLNSYNSAPSFNWSYDNFTFFFYNYADGYHAFAFQLQHGNYGEVRYAENKAPQWNSPRELYDICGRNRTQTCDSPYAGIMFDDPTIALCPKLRWHTDLTLVVREKD